MLDLQKKYAIISNILQVQHQARNMHFSFNGLDACFKTESRNEFDWRLIEAEARVPEIFTGMAI